MTFTHPKRQSSLASWGAVSVWPRAYLQDWPHQPQIFTFAHDFGTSAIGLYDGRCEMRFLSAGHYLRLNINYTQEGTQGLVSTLPGTPLLLSQIKGRGEGNSQLSSTYCMQAVPGAFLQIITLKTSAKQESKPRKGPRAMCKTFTPRVDSVGPLGSYDM